MRASSARVVVVASFLLAPGAGFAADPPRDPPSAPALYEPRAILRLDLALYGRGGMKGGGGTLIEDNGSSASFGSTAGLAAAVEVRVAGPVWLEVGTSAYPTDLEVVRDHGPNERIEVHEGSAATVSWSAGVDIRPSGWRSMNGALQVSVFARYVNSRFGEPPAAANVTMERRASGLNGGVRADLRARRAPWIVGMELSVGDAAPKITDLAAGTTRKVQTADLYLGLGVRRAF